MPLVFLALLACDPGGFVVGVPLLRTDVDTIDLGFIPMGRPTTFEIIVYNDGLADADMRAEFALPLTGATTLVVEAQRSATLRAAIELELPQPVDPTIRLSTPGSSAQVRVRAAGLLDADEDGYISSLAGGDDCDDNNPQLNPGVIDACNGIDDDCNGLADDPVEPVVWYADADADGFGDPQLAQAAGCTAPPGTVRNPDDCDDSDPEVNPAQIELWYDGTDQNCDGNDDDRDEDGFAVDDDCNDGNPSSFPGALEVDDGIDQDCDGIADEDFAARGDLVISEVHTLPSLASGAYIEILALGPRGIDPGLLTLNGAAVTGYAGLAPGQLGLLCLLADRTANGGLDCVGQVPIPASGVMEIMRNSSVLDEVDTSIAQPGPGMAADVDPAALDPDANDVSSAWCLSTGTAASGDAGTPNALPPFCPGAAP